MAFQFVSINVDLLDRTSREPMDELLKKEQIQRLREQIALLEDQERAVITHHLADGCPPISALAVALGTSECRLRRTLGKAMSKLHAHMLRGGYGYQDPLSPTPR